MPNLSLWPGGLSFSQFTFRPVRGLELARMEGRRTESMQTRPAFWRLEGRLSPLTPRQFGRFEAFHMQANAVGGVFAMYDAKRPRLALSDAPLVDDATAAVVSIVDSSNVVLSGLVPGLVFTSGDKIEFRESEFLRSLHVVLGDAVVDGSGEVALNFAYPLDLQHFTAAAVVHLEKPTCLMQFTKFEPVNSLSGTEVTLSAVEVFI